MNNCLHRFEFIPFEEVYQCKDCELDVIEQKYQESCHKWREQFEKIHQRAMKAEREVKSLKEQIAVLREFM